VHRFLLGSTEQKLRENQNARTINILKAVEMDVYLGWEKIRPSVSKAEQRAGLKTAARSAYPAQWPSHLPCGPPDSPYSTHDSRSILDSFPFLNHPSFLPWRVWTEGGRLVRTIANDIPSWRVLYQAAMLEPDAGKLPPLISSAHQAILERIGETITHPDAAEHKDLKESLNMLRILRKESKSCEGHLFATSASPKGDCHAQ
jgi:hypothetical protein